MLGHEVGQGSELLCFASFMFAQCFAIELHNILLCDHRLLLPYEMVKIGALGLKASRLCLTLNIASNIRGERNGDNSTHKIEKIICITIVIQKKYIVKRRGMNAIQTLVQKLIEWQLGGDKYK